MKDRDLKSYVEKAKKKAQNEFTKDRDKEKPKILLIRSEVKKNQSRKNAKNMMML